MQLATEIEDNNQLEPVFNLEHRIYVINSVLSAVAFLEAAINELFQDAYDEHQIYINGFASHVIRDLDDEVFEFRNSGSGWFRLN